MNYVHSTRAPSKILRLLHYVQPSPNILSHLLGIRVSLKTAIQKLNFSIAIDQLLKFLHRFFRRF